MSYVAIPLRLDEHREALGRLWAENMSDTGVAAAVAARMRWLYEQPPDGPTVTVLARHEETGELVGCGSIFRRAVWVDGRRVPAGVLCDFAVTKAHRIAGAALSIQRALLDAGRAAGLALIYGHPNEKSVAVFKRIGYRVVAETSRWVKPLRAGYKLRQRLAAPGVAAVLAAPVDAGLRARDLLRTLRAPRVRGEILGTLDARADALWERARGAHGVVGEKSAAYLDWRYRRYPTTAHHVLGVAPAPGARLVAWAAYFVRDGKAFVSDLFAEEAAGAVEAVLLALGRHLRGQRVDSLTVNYVGGPELGERLRAVGFLPRPGRRPLVLHPEAVGDAVRARVLDAGSWYMLDGELDF